MYDQLTLSISEVINRAADGRSIEPVVIEVRGDHAYRNRGKGHSGCGFALSSGEECRAAMFAPQHLSLPPSLNVVGSRGGHHTYRAFKEAWEGALRAELVRSGLPAGWVKVDNEPPSGTPQIRTISVEARLCFPVARFARDQGNYRWGLEKCLGDALERGGWLNDDCIYPERCFDFGGLEIEHRPGQAWTRMMLFPSL